MSAIPTRRAVARSRCDRRDHGLDAAQTAVGQRSEEVGVLTNATGRSEEETFWTDVNGSFPNHDAIAHVVGT